MTTHEDYLGCRMSLSFNSYQWKFDTQPQDAIVEEYGIVIAIDHRTKQNRYFIGMDDGMVRPYYIAQLVLEDQPTIEELLTHPCSLVREFARQRAKGIKEPFKDIYKMLELKIERSVNS